MLNPDPQPTCGVLYVDDEEKALKYFRMAFAPKFEIFTATSAAEGLEILARESAKIGIVLSDQRMPTTLGAEFLGAVREQYPGIVRILTTAYSDLESAISAVNCGHIYQYVVKPWEIPDLGMVLQRAADYHRVLSERNALLAVKMTTLQRILCSDRVKWLLLHARGLESAEQTAFLHALAALIGALPENLEPAPVAAGAAHRFFDIGALLHAEYANATGCLDHLAANSTGDPADPAPLLAALRGQAGVEAAEWADGRVQVTAKANAPATLAALRAALFGVLAERETSPLGVALLAALIRRAASGEPFVVAVGDEEFTFAVSSPSSPDEIIDLLADKFAAADISRL